MDFGGGYLANIACLTIKNPPEDPNDKYFGPNVNVIVARNPDDREHGTFLLKTKQSYYVKIKVCIELVEDLLLDHGVGLGAEEEFSVNVAGEEQLPNKTIVWESQANGHVCYGPGSYYLGDPDVTVMDMKVTTEDEARRVVEEMC